MAAEGSNFVAMLAGFVTFSGLAFGAWEIDGDRPFLFFFLFGEKIIN